MLLRIWVWLTHFPDWSYARRLTTGGLALIVWGLTLFALGRPGNTGLPLAAAGATTFAVGIVSYLVRRRWRSGAGSRKRRCGSLSIGC